jgi:hypothetical protein
MRMRRTQPIDDFEDLAESRPPVSIGSLHWIAWVFLVFALGDLAWFIVNANFSPTPSPSDFVVYALKVVPAVAALLFPAALFARHPNATSRAPVLLLGMMLFALVQGLLVLANPLQPIFETMTPASDDLPGLVPLAELYNGLTLLVAAIGLALIARGLSLARRYEDGSGRWLDLFVPAATVLATVVGIVATSRLPLPDGPIPPIYLLYLASSVTLGVLRVAVWAYLTVSAVRGWLAGEEPVVGWVLATLAGGVIVLALALLNIAGLVDVQDATIITVYGWAIVIAYTVGHLGLLAALAFGLPSLDDADADEPGYESGPVYEDEFPEERKRTR